MKRLAAFISALWIGLCMTACVNQAPRNENDRFEKSSPPIMGWASWNNYHVNINEEIIQKQADAMVHFNLSDFGYQYINIDDGFFGGRDSNGNIISHPKSFPSGMKQLAAYIHAKGLKAGIYSDAGINTCASHYDRDTIGAGMGMFGHEEQDLRLFLKEWDFDFLKVDWCGGQWLGLDEQSRYTAIGEMARKIKPTVVYNVCRWEFPGEWVTQIANSWRISGDLRANFNSVLNTIDANAGLWKYCSYGHYNDMDMLQVGRGMSYEEDKTQFSFWCLMHSPLLLGNDLSKISEETLSIITNEDLIEINQSSYVYQARLVANDDSLQVWGRPLVSTMSGEYAIILLNRSSQVQNYSFNLNSIGLIPGKGYAARDLWTKENFGESTDSLIARQLQPHSVVVLQLKGTSRPFNFFQSAVKQ